MRSGLLPSLRRRLGLLVRVETSEPLVALTFDDGPDPDHTPEVLDVLRRHNALATFFLDGPAAAEAPSLVQRIRDEGHAVGLHGWAHRSAVQDRSARGFASQVADIRRCAAGVGPNARLFRPPFGHSTTRTQLAAALLGYQAVYWNASVGDWSPSSSAALADSVVESAEAGAIVLLHDGLRHAVDPQAFDRGYLVRALDDALRQLGESYRFVTIPQLVSSGEPVYRLRSAIPPPLPPMAERPR